MRETHLHESMQSKSTTALSIIKYEMARQSAAVKVSRKRTLMIR